MDNLADIALDLICALKFSPPDGYEMEDLAALENACWQTMLHSLSDAEMQAVVAAARLQIEELDQDEGETLPEYLQEKRAALMELIDSDEDDET